MRIAVLLDDIYVKEIRKDVLHVFLFDVDDRLITAVGEELIRITDMHYLTLWFLGKRVNTVYCDYFAREEKRLPERAGITIKPLDEIRNNPIYQALLIRD